MLVDAIVTGNLDVRGAFMPARLVFAPMPLRFLLVATEFLRYLIGIDDMYGSRSDAKESV